MVEVVDPQVALMAAAAAAQAKASADYAAVLTTINIGIQAIVTITLAAIGYFQVVVPLRRASHAVVQQGEVMEKLEKNTNSIKDALVKQEGLLGEERGRQAEKAEAAAAAAAAVVKEEKK